MRLLAGVLAAGRAGAGGRGRRRQLHSGDDRHSGQRRSRALARHCRCGSPCTPIPACSTPAVTGRCGWRSSSPPSAAATSSTRRRDADGPRARTRSRRPAGPTTAPCALGPPVRLRCADSCARTSRTATVGRVYANDESTQRQRVRRLHGRRPSLRRRRPVHWRGPAGPCAVPGAGRAAPATAGWSRRGGGLAGARRRGARPGAAHGRALGLRARGDAVRRCVSRLLLLARCARAAAARGRSGRRPRRRLADPPRVHHRARERGSAGTTFGAGSPAPYLATTLRPRAPTCPTTTGSATTPTTTTSR